MQLSQNKRGHYVSPVTCMGSGEIVVALLYKRFGKEQLSLNIKGYHVFSCRYMEPLENVVASLVRKIWERATVTE